MERQVQWRVGVLRRGAENVDWISSGGSRTGQARAATITAVRELVAVDGRQEYRLQIDDVEGIVNQAWTSRARYCSTISIG